MIRRGWTLAVMLLVGVALLGSCTRRPPPVVPPAEQPPSDQRLFQEAEEAYRNRDYDTALERYHRYLEAAPRGSHADAVWMRIAGIQVDRGENQTALQSYETLISNHPHSNHVPDAHVEILALFLMENRHQELLQVAGDLLPAIMEGRFSSLQTVRIYQLMAESYRALDMLDEALVFLSRARSLAAGQDQERIAAQIADTLVQLSPGQIRAVARRLESPEGGDLVLLAARQMATAGLHASAAELFAELAEHYPDHPEAVQAAALAEEHRGRSRYSRVTVGCLLPLSGPYRAYGRRALKGVELALSSHGDPAVRIVFRDTASDPRTAMRAVEELDQRQVAAIVGPIITAEAAARHAQQLGVPIVTLTQKQGIADSGDYVFRNFLTPKMQAASLVAYACGERGMRRFAVLFPDENYGRTFMNMFWDEVIACGGEIVAVEAYRANQTDFADNIRKLVGLFYKVPDDIAAAARFKELEPFWDPWATGDSLETTPIPWIRPTPPPSDLPSQATPPGLQADGPQEPEPIVDYDAIFIPDAPKQAGLIIPQLAYYDATPALLLGTNLWHSPELIAMAPEFVRGAVLTSGFYDKSAAEEVRRFVDRYSNAYDERPSFIEAIAYDTTKLVLETMARPDIRSRRDLRDSMLQTRAFPGVTGSTSFAENGEAVKGLNLLRIRGNRFVELQGSGFASVSPLKPADRSNTGERPERSNGE